MGRAAERRLFLWGMNAPRGTMGNRAGVKGGGRPLVQIGRRTGHVWLRQAMPLAGIEKRLQSHLSAPNEKDSGAKANGTKKEKKLSYVR